MPTLKVIDQPFPEPSHRVTSAPVIVSMVRSATATQTLDISVEKVLEAIRTGGNKLKGQITQTRKRFEAELAITGDRKAARLAVDALKKQLPGVLWSGTFTYRANDKLVHHSGLLCADLDALGEQLPESRKKLLTSPYLWALFLSPTGDGLKAIFKVCAGASQHQDSYRAVEKHVKDLTGIQIDEKGKDVARLCFMSYDSDLYVNENAIELPPLPEPEKQKRPQNDGEHPPDLSQRERIATEKLGQLTWSAEKSGYFCQCPGESLHTTLTADTHTILYLDGSPTIKCQHNSCVRIVEAFTHQLRSLIAKAEYHAKPETSPGEGKSTAKEDNTPDDQAIARLAALPLLQYDRCREAQAKKLGCRESVLDKLVEAKRPKNRETNGLQVNVVHLTDVEPWPEPVNGAEILEGIAQRLEHYTVLPQGAADMLALWCAHTHTFKVFQISPRVHISSPTHECGKTTLRDCAAQFCARAKPTDNMTTAVMFRLVSGHSPTILADECDKWLFINEDLVGLIQSGHRKNANVMRCEGDSNELREFGCYAPVLLAAIGALPDQLHSRSIVVPLERATRAEIKPRARFDSEHVEIETELCRKLARWIADNRERIAACKPKLPENLFNRVADNWRPLFQIAEVAGGNWPQRCANALAKLTTREDEAESLRVMLLTDIQQVFAVERMFSRDLRDLLAAMEERPWPEVCRGGKPMTERWLARNLAVFGIHPKNLRIDEKQAKGYELADFDNAFSRYLLDTPFPSVPPSHTEGKTAKFYPSQNKVWDACENAKKPPFSEVKKEIWDVGTDKKGDTPENADFGERDAEAVSADADAFLPDRERSAGKEKLRL